MSRALFWAVSLENNIKKNMETDKAGEKERKMGTRNKNKSKENNEIEKRKPAILEKSSYPGLWKSKHKNG